MMSYTIEYKNNGYRVTHRGVITIHEINEANGRIHGHSRFDAHNFQIIDVREADFSSIDPARADLPGAIDSVASRTRRNVKVAVLAAEPKAVEFCQRYADTAKRYGSPWSFRLFPDLDSALNWLEVGPEDLGRME